VPPRKQLTQTSEDTPVLSEDQTRVVSDRVIRRWALWAVAVTVVTTMGGIAAGDGTARGDLGPSATCRGSGGCCESHRCPGLGESEVCSTSKAPLSRRHPWRPGCHPADDDGRTYHWLTLDRQWSTRRALRLRIWPGEAVKAQVNVTAL
jgi:hypothetical protein